jgi:hypothetical protein
MPAGRVARQDHVVGERAVRRRGERVAAELKSRRPSYDDRAPPIGQRPGVAVPDEAHETHGLAGSIDASVGVEIAVDALGCGAAGGQAVGGAGRRGRALLRKVGRGALEVQDRQVALRTIGHHHLGDQGAVALQQAMGERDPAGGVGLGGGERLAVLGQERDGRAANRPRGL